MSEALMPAMQEQQSALSRVRAFTQGKLGRMVMATTAFLGVAGGVQVTAERSAAADSNFVYHIENTGGDGVWMHQIPGFQGGEDLIKVIPDGTRIKADCFAYADPVGERNNPVWLHVEAEGTTGYVTDYYTSSRWTHNNTLKDQGLPECGSKTKQPAEEPQQKPTYNAVFYAPGDGENVYWQDQNIHMPPPPNAYIMSYSGNKHPRWRGSGNCDISKADDFEGRVDSRITTLAAWSIGRLAPIYYLKNSSAQERPNINHILLIDPGSRADYEDNPCDTRYDQSAILADWLREDKDNRLVIMAGQVTADYRNRSNGYGHAGIQNGLFPDIRGQEIASQVVVCNYDTIGHVEMYKNFNYLMGKSAIKSPSECPNNPITGKHAVGWRP